MSLWKKKNLDIKSPSGYINPMEVELRGLNNRSHSVEDLIFFWRKGLFLFFPSHEIFAVKWVSDEHRQNGTMRSYRLSKAFLADGRIRHSDWNEWRDFLSPLRRSSSPSRLCSDHGSFKHIKAATCGPILSGTFSGRELEIEPSFEPTLSWDHLLKERGKKEEGRGKRV